MDDQDIQSDDPRFGPLDQGGGAGHSPGGDAAGAGVFRERAQNRGVAAAVAIVVIFGVAFYFGYRVGSGASNVAAHDVVSSGHAATPGTSRDLIGTGGEWMILPIKPADGGPSSQELTNSLAKVDGKRVDVTLEGETYAWFAPRATWVKSQSAIEGAGQYEFKLQATMSGQIDAELRCDFYRDAACTSRWLRKRVPISQSPCTFEIDSTLAVIYCKPAIKLHGKGQFVVDRFSVTAAADHS